MEQAAEAVEVEQHHIDTLTNMTSITLSLCMFGLDNAMWEKNAKDNYFLLKTFVIQWIGIDPAKLKLHQLTVQQDQTKCPSPPSSLLEVHQSDNLQTLLRTAKQHRLRSRRTTTTPTTPTTSSTPVVGYEIVMELPTDRQEDIEAVEKSVEKMHAKEEGAEINIAMIAMIHEVGGTR